MHMDEFTRLEYRSTAQRHLSHNLPLNTFIHNREKIIILISKLRLLDTALSSQLWVIGLADKQTLIFLHYSDAGMFAVP